VGGVDFEIGSTECVGFLGPNGAGKTTLMRLIYSALHITAGELRVFGRRPMVERKAINAQVGVVFQDNNLDEELSARDGLLVHALYCGLSPRDARRRIDGLLDWLGLAQKAGSPIRALSGGMVRRLMIARALVNSPRLLILDEPTTGLDPQVRHTIWGLLRELKRQGLTILLTTHYMEEAQQLSDRVMIMDHGRIILSGAPNALVEEHLERYVLQVSGLAETPQLNGGIRHERAGDVQYFYCNEERLLREVHESLPRQAPPSRTGFGKGAAQSAAQSAAPMAVLRHANLEDVFLKFTGRGLNE
jgi:lipooligosaccharide transport system ATP-binding protein